MGIKCDSMEHSSYHIHTELLIFINGKSFNVPENIGILPDNHCLFWLHTHQNDGIIHIESPTDSTFTLGQFFAIWNFTKHDEFINFKENLSQSNFTDPLVYINENLLKIEDIFLIPLRDGDELKLVYGDSTKLKSYFVVEKMIDPTYNFSKTS